MTVKAVRNVLMFDIFSGNVINRRLGYGLTFPKIRLSSSTSCPTQSSSAGMNIPNVSFVCLLTTDVH